MKEPQIVVKDRICGGGKSQGMIQQIKETLKTQPNELFLYITPYLEQCHTIAGTTPIGVNDPRPMFKGDEIVYEENDRNLGCIKMKHPDNRNSCGTKQESLRRLFLKKEHIISTHNLFLNMKLDTMDGAENYTLIIDEALDVFDRCSLLSEKEVKKLLLLNILYLKEDGITLGFDRTKFGNNFNLGVDEDAVEDTTYEELAVLCDNNQILLVNGHVMVWEFSAEILKKFKKVYILTYLFEGREMSVYLKKHGIDYVVERSGKGGKDIAHLIDVLDDEKLNSVGDDYFALSISKTKGSLRNRVPPHPSKYSTQEQYVAAVKRYESSLLKSEEQQLTANQTNDILRKNLHTVFSTRWKAKSNDRLFTCLAQNATFIAGKNYTKNWLAYSTRATNLYMDTHHVAFLMNVFMLPTIKQVCDSTDFTVDEDLVALSHLIQFVFRSAVRKGEPIKVYIPSSRMRGLFIDYLNGVYDV